MSKIDLTFGIPMYNCEKYIKELLECFDYNSKLKYEIIIVNDGSNDSSLKIVNDFKRENIKIINQTNSGVSSARNVIIEQASGEWLTFVDADDLINFKEYEKTIKKIEKNDDYIICIKDKKDYNYLINNPNNSIVYTIEKSIINSPFNKFFKTEILKKNKILFDKNISLGEDALFNINYLRYSKKIAYLNVDMYFYRKINSNSLARKFNVNKFEELMYVNEKSKIFSQTLEEKKALEYIRILNSRGCIADVYKFSKKFGNIKAKLNYIKKIKSYKKMKLCKLNGFKQTYAYYQFYCIPSIIWIALSWLKNK